MSRRRTRGKQPGRGESKHRKARVQRFSTKNSDSPRAWWGQNRPKPEAPSVKPEA